MYRSGHVLRMSATKMITNRPAFSSPPAYSRPSLLPAPSCEGFALLRQSETHLLIFQLVPHSLQKHSGVTKSVSFNSSTLHLSTFSVLSPLESALTDEHRVGFRGLYLQTLSRQATEISRNRPPTARAESTLTESRAVSPLDATLTKRRGRGRAVMLRV